MFALGRRGGDLNPPCGGKGPASTRRDKALGTPGKGRVTLCPLWLGGTEPWALLVKGEYPVLFLVGRHGARAHS